MKRGVTVLSELVAAIAELDRLVLAGDAPDNLAARKLLREAMGRWEGRCHFHDREEAINSGKDRT